MSSRINWHNRVFSVVPKSKMKNMEKMHKDIHDQKSRKASREKISTVVAKLKAMKRPETVKKVANGIEEPMTYCNMPSEHWTKNPYKQCH